MFTVYSAYRALPLAILLGIATTNAYAAKSAGSGQCYRVANPARCFVEKAQGKLERIAKANDRAKAIAELLYAMAVTGVRTESIQTEARTLAADASVAPLRQLDLLFALDMYASAISPSSDDTYEVATSRFADLDTKLQGGERIELYINTCAIVSWDESIRERWLSFAERVCTPERLAKLKGDGRGNRSIVWAMLPVAMTLAESSDGFILAAEQSLTVLSAAETVARKSGKDTDHEFVALLGVLTHTMNSLCFDAFELPDAADVETERARQVLRRWEKRIGIVARSTYLRRQVVESMFDTGRELEAKRMLQQMLNRVDADPGAKIVPWSEQVAILMLAARLAHYEAADRRGACVPDAELQV
jgi:hypothetical protein